MNYQANSPAGCGFLLAFIAFELVAVYPLFGLLILSANQRAEDVLALKAMGVNVGLSVPAELGWFVTLLLAGITIVARLPQQLMTNTEGDELSAAGEVLKSLVVIPLAYFFLPAWIVVLATWLAAFAGVWWLMTIAWGARS